MDISPDLLRYYRAKARLSQQDVADGLGLSQAQASRYEADPTIVPLEKVLKWLELCGVDLVTALQSSLERDQVTTGGLDAGAPYGKLVANLDLLQQYVSADAPEVPPGVSFRPADLLRRINGWRAKPFVVLAGRFDSGKSKLANSLLGGDRLPSQWTPTTSVITVVRHWIEDRPDWQKEEVWLMDRDFKFGDWNNEEKCGASKIVGGGFDTLRRFGTKSYSTESQEVIDVLGSRTPKWALAYVNAPILSSCTVIDLPGFGDDKTTDVFLESQDINPAVVIYACSLLGFLSAEDLSSVGYYLRRLLQGDSTPDFQLALSRLVIAATHAGPNFDPDEIKDILTVGGKRMYGTFEDMIRTRGGETVSAASLSQRMFPFWAELPPRREKLEAELRELLGSTVPAIVESDIEHQISEFKANSKSQLGAQIVAYERALREIAFAQQRLAELNSEKVAFRDRIQRSAERVSAAIRGYKLQTRTFIQSELMAILTVEFVESFIDDLCRVEGEEETKIQALPKLSETIQSRLENKISEFSKELKSTIEKFLDQATKYHANEASGLKSAPLSVPYDMRAAFVGGILGATLGTSIAFTTKTAILTAFGLGSSTAALAFIPGGIPILLALGLSSFVTLIMTTLLKERWQKRLARRIVQKLQTSGLKDELMKNADTYWDQSASLFEIGSGGVLRNFDEYILNLTDLLAERDRTKIDVLLKKLDRLKLFFEEIPWRSV